MRIQLEIDKIGASLCNKSVSNIPTDLFAVFETDDEVFGCSVHQLLKNVSAIKTH